MFCLDRNAFEMYQAEQSSDIFRDCEGLFSFLGLPGRRALFVGAYRVVGKRPRFREEEIPDALREFWSAQSGGEGVAYALERDSRFAPMEMRVVVDWGDGALAWHQWKLDKPVVELRPRGELHPCPDYRDLEVSLAVLSHIFRHESANPSWVNQLSAVGGIYLLTDQRNNKLYVGQAGGEGGFWGRWRSYAEGNTGNLRLDPAFAEGTIDPAKTTLSILEIVPRGSQAGEQLNRLEERWKRRLRSRSDYNAN